MGNHAYNVPYKLMYLFKDTNLNTSAVFEKSTFFFLGICVMCYVIVVMFFVCPQFWQWNRVDCPLCFLGMQKIYLCYNSLGKWCQMWYGTIILFRISILPYNFMRFSIFWKQLGGCENLKELWRRVEIARVCFCNYSKLLHWVFFFFFFFAFLHFCQ